MELTNGRTIDKWRKNANYECWWTGGWMDFLPRKLVIIRQLWPPFWTGKDILSHLPLRKRSQEAKKNKTKQRCARTTSLCVPNHALNMSEYWIVINGGADGRIDKSQKDYQMSFSKHIWERLIWCMTSPRKKVPKTSFHSREAYIRETGVYSQWTKHDRCIYIIPLSLIQLTEYKQNLVYNN